MRRTRLALVLSALVAGAACGSDSTTPSVDARVNAIDARLGADASPGPSADAPVNGGEDAPVTEADAAPAADAPENAPDAAPGETPDASSGGGPDAMVSTIPDISGTFLFSILPVVGGDAAPALELIATTTLDTSGGSPKLNIHAQFLKTGDLTIVTEHPADFTNVAVAPDGTFSISLAILTIPAASSITGMDLDVTGVSITGSIKTADLYCGSLDGTVLTAPLTGSTFGAIRVPPGQVGHDLPAPTTSCPTTKR